MAKIIALINQKGGVGKTTTAVNMAAALTKLGKKTLVCDFDPQGNSTSGLGIDQMNLETTIYEVLIGKERCADVIIQTKWADVLGSNVNLAGAEIDLISIDDREFRLRNVLNTVKDNYDYILIDCPPSLGILTINCLCAADSFIVPLQCEYYALEGLSQLIATVKAIQSKFNPKIELDGILFTMYDGRTNLSMQVVEEVKAHFATKVYKNVIPRNVRLSEAPSHGVPITDYDPLSKGSVAYIEFTKEFLQREV